MVPMTGTNLPDADTLITAARKAMTEAGDDPDRRRQAATRALDAWAPAIDQYADVAGAALFTGLAAESIRRMKRRLREDGTRQWPEPDSRFGGSPVWHYRTIVIARAEAPGHGHPGMRLGRTNAGKRRHPTA